MKDLCIAIMQPTYLPWTGYFALMDQVDVFVVLDDVQFDRRSWQQRNRINSIKGTVWLTVPVLSKGRRFQLINEVLINTNEKWQRKHLNAIYHNCAQSQFLSLYESWFDKIYSNSWTSLCELNINLIRGITEFLGINTSIIQASELKTEGKRVSKLINICHSLGANDYLSPLGSFEYNEKDNHFADSDINLLFQNYDHPIYRQQNEDFISYLSVIDLMLNEGMCSLEVIRSGMKVPYTIEEVQNVKAKEQIKE